MKNNLRPVFPEKSNNDDSFPEILTQFIHHQLKAKGFSLDKPEKLASPILKLSNAYIENRPLSDIWSDPDLSSAYLAYFFPLNFQRLRHVFRHIHNVLQTTKGLVDFGSGCGTSLAALMLTYPEFKGSLLNIESSQKAQSILKDLHNHLKNQNLFFFNESLPQDIDNSLFNTIIFSYSLNELDELPRFLHLFDNVIILEPSTHFHSRKLSNWRQKLIAQAYQIIAPCTHQEACPLITQSQKDWCHIRIPNLMPEWYWNLEKYLPFSNRTLTLSYLCASRTHVLKNTLPSTPKTHTEKAQNGNNGIENKEETPTQYIRVLGDTLYEKGKVKQLICRGPQREFLAWLKREKDAPILPSGSLLENHQHLEFKNNELRGLTQPLILNQLPLIMKNDTL